MLTKRFIDAVEKLAFEIPAPNLYTPQFVQMCISARLSATQAAGVRVVPEDSLAQPYADPWMPSFTGTSTEAPALGEGWMPIETAPTEGDDGLGMIAIGRNAQANLPGEFVLNVELDKQQNIYTTFRTILSEPEFTMLSNILRRMIRDAAT